MLMKRRLVSILLLITSLVITNCRPTLYCLVINHADSVVSVDFEGNGNGAFQPHFRLKPGESRRVVAGPALLVHDITGRLIDTLDITRAIDTRNYVNLRTQTITVVITNSAIVAQRAGE